MKLFAKIFKPKTSETILPEGWTDTKEAEDLFVTEIPNVQKDTWKNERREKDSVEQLIKIDGFHDIPNGRTGTIYYVKNGKVCELHYEISGVLGFDILIYFDQLTEWVLPEVESMSFIDKQSLKLELQNWLNSNQIRARL